MFDQVNSQPNNEDKNSSMFNFKSEAKKSQRNICEMMLQFDLIEKSNSEEFLNSQIQNLNENYNATSNILQSKNQCDTIQPLSQNQDNNISQHNQVHEDELYHDQTDNTGNEVYNVNNNQQQMTQTFPAEQPLVKHELTVNESNQQSKDHNTILFSEPNLQINNYVSNSKPKESPQIHKNSISTNYSKNSTICSNDLKKPRIRKSRNNDKQVDGAELSIFQSMCSTEIARQHAQESISSPASRLMKPYKVCKQDWFCNYCFNINYNYRNQCLKCSQPKLHFIEV